MHASIFNVLDDALLNLSNKISIILLFCWRSSSSWMKAERSVLSRRASTCPEILAKWAYERSALLWLLDEKCLAGLPWVFVPQLLNLCHDRTPSFVQTFSAFSAPGPPPPNKQQTKQKAASFDKLYWRCGYSLNYDGLKRDCLRLSFVELVLLV